MAVVFETSAALVTPSGHVHIDVLVGPDLEHLTPAGRLVVTAEEATALEPRLTRDLGADERLACARELEAVAAQVEQAAAGQPSRLVPYETTVVAALRMVAATMRVRARDLITGPATAPRAVR